MATYTPNYGLHQWVPEDNFQRTDFNEDLQKIDMALGAKSEIVIGVYTGNGGSSQTIYLGFQPKAVLVENQLGQRTYNSGIHGGLATPDMPLKYNDTMAMEIYSSGFRVYYTQYQSNTNASGEKFIYVAFK